MMKSVRRGATGSLPLGIGKGSLQKGFMVELFGVFIIVGIGVIVAGSVIQLEYEDNLTLDRSDMVRTLALQGLRGNRLRSLLFTRDFLRCK